MAVVLKINPGFDASYPWREIGTGDRATTSPLDYYLVSADKGGEPPGRWAGRGLGVLGFAAGQIIDQVRPGRRNCARWRGLRPGTWCRSGT